MPSTIQIAYDPEVAGKQNPAAIEGGGDPILLDLIYQDPFIQ